MNVSLCKFFCKFLICVFLYLGLRTIQVKNANFQGTIGQRSGLSKADLQQLKQLYKCNSMGVTGKKTLYMNFFAQITYLKLLVISPVPGIHQVYLPTLKVYEL